MVYKKLIISSFSLLYTHTHLITTNSTIMNSYLIIKALFLLCNTKQHYYRRPLLLLLFSHPKKQQQQQRGNMITQIGFTFHLYPLNLTQNNAFIGTYKVIRS